MWRAALWLALCPIRAEAQTLTFDGEVPEEGGDFLLLPFDVPEGIAEIEVRHDDLSEADILDWGLRDPAGAFRGWGGGNTEPAVVGIDRASRSYLPGPLPAGEWTVHVGKAKIPQPPARYHVEIDLRDEPTLEAQPERAPYAPGAALETGSRWFAGDFHVHSRDSGDARPALDEIADFARSRGLDFVVITDHNTVAQLEFFADAQSRHPDLLFVPGIEVTTYDGHANAVGATRWVEHEIGLDGATMEEAARQVVEQGAIFSINHPALDIGDFCIGCGWHQDVSLDWIGGVEIASGGYSQSGYLLDGAAMDLWEGLCAQGRHVAPLGGSDDHRAGVDLSGFQSPIGDPTTMVFAEELSVAALLEGIRQGRTVVKLQGPGDPMIELSSSVPVQGDTIWAAEVTLTATVTNGVGARLLLLRDGEQAERLDVDSDPFVAEVVATAPAEGESRWRAETTRESLTTVTSHLYLRLPAEEPAAPVLGVGGGGCHSAPGAPIAAGFALVWLAGLVYPHQYENLRRKTSAAGASRTAPRSSEGSSPAPRSTAGT